MSKVPGRQFWIREIVGKVEHSAENIIHLYLPGIHMRTHRAYELSGLDPGLHTKYRRFCRIPSEIRFIRQTYVLFSRVFAYFDLRYL